MTSSSTTSTSSCSAGIRRARVGFFITKNRDKHRLDFLIFWDTSLKDYILEFDGFLLDSESWIFGDSEFELVGSIITSFYFYSTIEREFHESLFYEFLEIFYFYSGSDNLDEHNSVCDL